jgi:hypothetical protein
MSMTTIPWRAAAEPQSIIRDEVGPSYERLRPARASATTASFPVYHDLVATMAKQGLAHPDETVAHVLATCAGYAYSDAGTVAMMMTRLGLEHSLCREITRAVDAMLIRATAHIVQSRDGRIAIVAFRGTPPLDIISWLLDADVSPEKAAIATDGDEPPDVGYDVHAGFYRNVRIIRHEVVHALQQALHGEPVVGATTDTTFSHVGIDTGDLDTSAQQSPLQHLYVTGHSLGGAMAALFATMLVMSEDPERQAIAEKLRGVYTFGQPMVASKAFAEYAAGRLADADVPLLRYVYKRDPVPKLPPGNVGDFAHFGDEYRLRSGGWVPSAPSRPMPLASGLLTAFASFGLTKFLPLRDLPFQYKIEDHFPHHYVTSLIPEGKTDEFGDHTMRLPD